MKGFPCAADDKFESSKEIEEKGFRLWDRFELDEALQVFLQGVERFPEDRKLKLGLAFTRLDLGDLPDARALFEELLAMNPKDDECWWGLGRIHLLLSNYGEARYAFDQALHLGKPDERVLLDVAKEWYLLAMYEESLDFYRRAFQANPKSPEALLGVERHRLLPGPRGLRKQPEEGPGTGRLLLRCAQFPGQHVLWPEAPG